MRTLNVRIWQLNPTYNACNIGIHTTTNYNDHNTVICVAHKRLKSWATRCVLRAVNARRTEERDGQTNSATSSRKIKTSAPFLQRVSIERCISYDRFCLTVWPSDRLSVTRWYHAKTTPAPIMRSSLEDSPMILVSWRLTSPRNSKGNIGSEGAEWERGSKHVAKIGNF